MNRLPVMHPTFQNAAASLVDIPLILGTAKVTRSEISPVSAVSVGASA